jgi:LacI family transcriptional regulator
MAVTLKDIARQTGLSLPTVSHVLGSRSHKYPPETRERVLSAARELGYRVNAYARAVRAGRFNTVALLLSTQGVRSILPDGLLEGVHDALVARQQRLLVAREPDAALTDEHFVPEILRESSSDGLLINYNALIPERLIALVAENRLPVVWINSKHDADCVYPDDRGGASEAVRRLYEIGHRRIAYLDPVHSSHYSSEDRFAGYREAVRALGLPELVYRPDQGLDHGQWPDVLARYLDAPADARPTAAVTYIGAVAEAALRAADRLGLRVPEDLSLVGIGDVGSRHLGLSFGGMVIDQTRVGREAVEMLLAKIADPALAFPPRPVPLVFAAGGSVAPPSP